MLVTIEEGFKTIAVSQVTQSEEAWRLAILAGFSFWLLDKAIDFTKKQKDNWDQIKELQQAAFLEGIDVSQRACLVGKRYQTRVCEFDKFAASRAFGSPLFIRATKKLRKVISKEPIIVSPGISPIYIGGWRPLREVEPLLRSDNSRYVFAIEENGKQWVPSRDELEAIRHDFGRHINWIVRDKEAKGKNKWVRPEYRDDKSIRSDLLILTKVPNRSNTQSIALALSGTHKEGTLAGGIVTSERKFLEKLAADQTVKQNCLNELGYQMLVRCYFEPSKTTIYRPDEVRLGDIKVLGATRIT